MAEVRSRWFDVPVALAAEAFLPSDHDLESLRSAILSDLRWVECLLAREHDAALAEVATELRELDDTVTAAWHVKRGWSEYAAIRRSLLAALPASARFGAAQELAARDVEVLPAARDRWQAQLAVATRVAAEDPDDPALPAREQALWRAIEASATYLRDRLRARALATTGTWSLFVVAIAAFLVADGSFAETWLVILAGALGGALAMIRTRDALDPILGAALALGVYLVGRWGVVFELTTGAPSDAPLHLTVPSISLGYYGIAFVAGFAARWIATIATIVLARSRPPATDDVIPTRGTVRIRHEVSAELRASLPHEVRDKAYRLVDPATLLAPGVYRVTQVLETGMRDVRLVDVREIEATSVQFGVATETMQAWEVGRSWPVAGLDAVRGWSQTTPDNLFLASGITTTPLGVGAWGLIGAEHPGVPWVAIAQSNELASIAVPLGPGQRCIVRVVQGKALRLAIELPPELTILRALEAMMSNGAIDVVIDVAVRAARDADDTHAAALAGLILYRLDRLDAAPPGSLPDHGILEAALTIGDKDRAVRDAGLETLLAATRSGMTMFRAAHALAISLLRGWPDPERADERAARASALLEHFDDDDPGVYTQLRFTADRS